MAAAAGLRGITYADLLARQAQAHGDRPAFVSDDGRAVTHREHQRRVQQRADALHRAGIARGDRIALLARNGIGFVELLGAAAQLGAVVSLVSWRLSAAEVAAVLANDTPSLVFADAEFRSLLPADQPALPTHDHGGDAAMTPPCPALPDDPLLLVHTAWTDGRPRAAMLSHGNLLAGAQQLQGLWRLGAVDVHLCCLPLFHITAVSLLLATQLAGGCSVLARKFDAATALSQIESHGVSLMAEFAPMLDGLLDCVGDNSAALASLRHLCGLDSPPTIARFEALCPAARFWSGYGQAEAGGMVAAGLHRDAPAAAGLALPLCHVALVDDDGQPVAAGEVGEIVVRGPTVFLGYRGRSDETAFTLRDGWLHTGDSGRFDDAGRLVFSGRLPSKALIKTGGENVYPGEVEAALRQHPEVIDAVVFGVPDARWGEAVTAVCSVRPRGEGVAPVDEAALIAFVGSRIARHKRPRRVAVVAALPLAADGRPDRQRVVELYGAVQV